MTTNDNQVKSINRNALINSMFWGGALALAVIAMFVFSVEHPKPEWGEYWKLRPLIITPIAGACGGILVYFINRARFQGSAKILAMLFSLALFAVVLWMGIVLGLDGTLWN